MELLLVIMVLLAGGGAGLWIGSRRAAAARAEAERQAREAVALERERARRIAELDAKEAVLAEQARLRGEAEVERAALAETLARLRQREGALEVRAEALDEQEQRAKQQEAVASAAEAKARAELLSAQERVAAAQRELERVASLTQAEARAELVASIEVEARRAAAVRIKRVEEEAAAEARERAARVIAAAMQRYAGELVTEKAVSVVELPSDEMKGRIIGREGRNIRALEAATGVDVVIDDTPEAVVVSGFNPVRREIAKLSLERLIADGRIHPARIEEVVEKVAEEIDELIRKAGEQAAFDLTLQGVHPELIKLIGRLRYRVTSGQNALAHSVEVARLASLMAGELGVNAAAARRAGLLHDIGLAVELELEGNHAEVGAEAARRLGEKDDIVLAIRAHDDADPPSLLATLVHVANAMANGRPGARRDAVELYVKRLEELERIARSFDGVERAFAVQAGREVRVIVDFARVGEEDTLPLAQDIARRIQDELTYPGEVRVTVVREARATEIAR